jgi:trafficking protein particle complex subunit 11
LSSYYKNAYLSLLDIRIYDTNLLEIKTIAGIINYKLCQLYFEIKHPIDAIEQFRKHIDIFRIKIGPAELAFEHYAWLSKQFQIMGELFEDAIKKGNLQPVQSQHPGFYFHSAANNAIQRRVSSKEFISKTYALSRREWTAENPSPIESLNSLEFYGQRPWRQGQQGMEILDQQKERDGISCLQELESKENLTVKFNFAF